MLEKLFPRFHHRYLSLPILGSVLEDYVSWMARSGYPRTPIRRHVRAARRLDRRLRRHGLSGLGALTRERLRACAPADSQVDVDRAALVRSLERFLDSRAVFAEPQLNRVEGKAAEYASFLRDMRGFAPATVAQHAATATRFLDHLGFERRADRLSKITRQDIEDFIRNAGRRIGRTSLQHSIAHVRGFLRFLAVNGEAPTGLDVGIDTPRVYRGEQLPRALPWKTVSALLRSIDRSSPIGKRDDAMFLLMATYGLRTIDVASMKLDDIDWRASQLHVPQRKTPSSRSRDVYPGRQSIFDECRKEADQFWQVSGTAPGTEPIVLDLDECPVVFGPLVHLLGKRPAGLGRLGQIDVQ